MSFQILPEGKFDEMFMEITLRVCLNAEKHLLSMCIYIQALDSDTPKFKSFLYPYQLCTLGKSLGPSKPQFPFP